MTLALKESRPAPKLQRQAISDLSKLNPATFSRMVIIDWAIILAASAIFLYSSNWFTLLIAVLLIGGRQHSLFILMHDATHFRAYSNRKIADRISNVFLAWPMGYCIEDYRKSHFAHHRSTNSEDDPDFRRRMGNPQWVFPMRRADFIRMFVRDLTGTSLLSEWCQNGMGAIKSMRRSTFSTLHWKQFLPALMPLVLCASSIPFGALHR